MWHNKHIKWSISTSTLLSTVHQTCFTKCLICQSLSVKLYLTTIQTHTTQAGVVTFKCPAKATDWWMVAVCDVLAKQNKQWQVNCTTDMPAKQAQISTSMAGCLPKTNSFSCVYSMFCYTRNTAAEKVHGRCQLLAHFNMVLPWQWMGSNPIMVRGT